jgi:hypothetical protein
VSEVIIDKWTIQKRTQIVELYFLNRCSVVKAQHEFRRARCENRAYRQSHMKMGDSIPTDWFSVRLKKVR